jgi:hypothetical protein
MPSCTGLPGASTTGECNLFFPAGKRSGTCLLCSSFYLSEIAASKCPPPIQITPDPGPWKGGKPGINNFAADLPRCKKQKSIFWSQPGGFYFQDDLTSVF